MSSPSPNPQDSSVFDPANRIGPLLTMTVPTNLSDSAEQATRQAGWACMQDLVEPPYSESAVLANERILSLVFGSLLAKMGDSDAHDKPDGDVIRTLNILERSLAGLAGLSLLALAAVLIVQTGVIPLNSSITASRDIAASSVAAPFRAFTLWIVFFFFAGLGYTSVVFCAPATIEPRRRM
ncbi:hypothetical protein JCM11641_004161 [Rhodosporidiobolus odoratus]